MSKVFDPDYNFAYLDENTKRITRLPGWLEKWTYY